MSDISVRNVDVQGIKEFVNVVKSNLEKCETKEDALDTLAVMHTELLTLYQDVTGDEAECGKLVLRWREITANL